MQDNEIYTSSGILLEPAYNEINSHKDLGRPGDYPFTRGIHTNMYRGKQWTMRQYAGFGSARESNKRYLQLLKLGQTGLSVAFDLPTQMGYDSDHIMASGEVGRVGVAISSIEDMDLLLREIPLDKVSTSMTINSTAGILLAFYIAIAKRRGLDPSCLQGTIQNDLLKEYIARGTYIFPPQPSMRIITDIFEFCGEQVPNWNTISISGYHIREAGSTAAQELAFTLANAKTYVSAALERGLNIDAFASRLSFFFNVHNNFFEEIAKFRAARRMWAQMMRNDFGAKNPNSWKLRFHSQTAGSTLTAQQPENNIARVALQALASVLGGTQSLHTNSMDEALGLPTEKSATIALRTQQILANESGVSQVADPLGGSYFVESLTNELEKKALEYLVKIDSLGGVIPCIESGYIQNEIQSAAYKFQKDLDSGKQKLVGVNAFADESEIKPQPLKIEPKIEKDQIRRLKLLKKKRNPTQVKRQLEKIEQAAAKNMNLMPLFIESVERNITLGEISGGLRKVFGLFKPGPKS